MTNLNKQQVIQGRTEQMIICLKINEKGEITTVQYTRQLPWEYLNLQLYRLCGELKDPTVHFSQL